MCINYCTYLLTYLWRSIALHLGEALLDRSTLKNIRHVCTICSNYWFPFSPWAATCGLLACSWLRRLHAKRSGVICWRPHVQWLNASSPLTDIYHVYYQSVYDLYNGGGQRNELTACCIVTCDDALTRATEQHTSPMSNGHFCSRDQQFVNVIHYRVSRRQHRLSVRRLYRAHFHFTLNSLTLPLYRITLSHAVSWTFVAFVACVS